MAATVWAGLDDRYPWVGRLWRWGISVCSLGLGLATLFVFRRGLPHVGWIVGYLLLLWVIFAMVTELRAALEQRGRRLVVDASEYVIVSLCHGLLLFVLPAYYASATVTSANVVVLAGVAAAALVTSVDPASSGSPSSPRSTWRCRWSACGPSWRSRAARLWPCWRSPRP